MTPKTQSQRPAGTGPLAPAEIGTFTFRDGVWYVVPKPQTTKPAR